MIMDIALQFRGTDLEMSTILENSDANKIKDLSMSSSVGNVTKKRSFDVAFLMQPDEKVVRQGKVYCNPSPKKVFHSESNISIKADALLRQMGSPNSSVVDDTSSVGRNSTDSPANEEIDIMTNGNSNSSYGSGPPMDPVSIQDSVRYFTSQVNRNIVNGGSTIHPRIFASGSPPPLSDLEVHRSAFTKVPHVRLGSPSATPLSPDRLSCSSISPPASTSPPRQFSNFRAATEYGIPSHFPQFMQPNHQSPAQHYHGHAHPSASSLNGASGNDFKGAINPQFFYRPPSQEQLRALSDMSPNGYSQFQMMTSSTTPPTSPPMHPFSNDFSGIVRHPAAAAAILSTLIPPTIATTFSLAAQNICAKCNISFRMTSDLVYHMRSHHKSENVNESHRRKREDKLKCPVCNESFRERHHLTRHMTAHQDKASDDVEPPQSAGRNNNQQLLMAQEFNGNKGRQGPGCVFRSISQLNGKRQ